MVYTLVDDYLVSIWASEMSDGSKAGAGTKLWHLTESRRGRSGEPEGVA